jgi:hypothetical protein
MRYAIEMGFNNKFKKDSFSHPNVDQEDSHTYRHTDSMEVASHKPTFIFPK